MNAPSSNRSALALLALGLAVLVPRALGDSAPVTPSPDALKQLSVDELMDMAVTSVSRRPEKLADAASAIQVITGNDIASSGATSIPEALRLASNLEVAQIDSRQWAITARGFNDVFADKMLVLIDGRSVYTPLYAGVYWDVQDTFLEDLDRIEVISGPGATQWGSNAVNGVINITTKSAKDSQGGLLEGGAGTELLGFGGARYGGELAPNVYFRVYAKYFERGESVTPSDQSAEDAWRMGQGGFRVDWDKSADVHLTLQGDLYKGSVTQPSTGDIQISGGNMLGRWSRSLAENSDIQLQVYYDRTYRLIPGSFTQTINTYDIDFQHRFPIGAQDIVWGVDCRLMGDDIINTPADAFLPPDVTQGLYSAFVQDEVSLIGGRLHLTAGTKVEHNDYTGVEIQPSVRAAWNLTQDQTTWAAVSRAVRTPSRIDVDLYSPATPPYRIAGGPNVVSEKVIAYELGYRAQVDPRIALAISTFYNDYTDLRSLEPLKPPAAYPVERSSGLIGHSAGAELTADWRLSPSWRLHGGYTELRVHTEPQPGSIDRSAGRSISRDPNHQFSLRSQVNLSAKWEWDTDVRYVGPITNQAVPGYAEMDLRLAWQIDPAWEFSVVGQNLLHAHHPEFNPPGSRREIQRSVYGKTSWRF